MYDHRLAAETYQEAYETEKHFHNYERWCGKSGDQSGTNWCDEASLLPFIAVSGDGAFGAGIKIIGSTDTPNQANMVKFNLHKVGVTTIENVSPWYLRFIFDLDGDGEADTPEAAGYYTDVWIQSFTAVAPQVGGSAINFISNRVAVGIPVWAKAKNATNLDEIDFFVGFHEYLR